VPTMFGGPPPRASGDESEELPFRLCGTKPAARLTFGWPGRWLFPCGAFPCGGLFLAGRVRGVWRGAAIRLGGTGRALKRRPGTPAFFTAGALGSARLRGTGRALERRPGTPAFLRLGSAPLGWR
jgi:hypothetical protein